MRPTGSYVTCTTAGEQFQAFIPAPLPPDPPLQMGEEEYDLIEKANRALGRLDGVTTLLPDASLFIYFYVRKEALLSSQIEGTQSSFSDLLLYESEQSLGVPLEDVREVSSYVAAMNHGLRRIREDNFPLTLRLIREVHKVLLAKGRGSERNPGEFRRTQNWIGGSRPGDALFVPPPPEHVIDCMGNLERFIHDKPRRTPVLIKAALTHMQFETIHPFLDGNGRVGRLLTTLLLCSEGVLQEPLLYLSLYLKQNRQEYYDSLQKVRTEGDWIAWLRFFLTGVQVTAQQAAETSHIILRRFEEDSQKIEDLGRGAASARHVHHFLKKQPITSVPLAVKELGLTAPTVRSALEHLKRMGIVRETTGKKRDRIYVYDPYVKILDEGTEPFR